MSHTTLEQARILFFESQSFAERILETYLEPNDFHCETVSTKSPGLFMEIIEKCAIEMAFFAFDAEQKDLLMDLMDRSRKERSRLKRVLFLEKEELGQVQSDMEELIDEFIVMNMDIQEFAIRFRKLHRDALLERNMISQEELKALLGALDEEALEGEEVAPEEPEAAAWATPEETAEEAEALEATSSWEAPLVETAPPASPVEEDIWSWDVEDEEEVLEEPQTLEVEVMTEPEEEADPVTAVETFVPEETAWAEEHSAPTLEPVSEMETAVEEEALEAAPALSSDAEEQEELDRMLKKLLEDEAVLEKTTEEEAQAIHKEKATAAARGVIPQPAEWYLRSAGHGGATIYEAEEASAAPEKTSASLYSVKAPEPKGEQTPSGEKSRASYEEDIRVTIMGLNEKKKKSLLKKVVGGVIGAIGVGGLVYTFILQIGI